MPSLKSYLPLAPFSLEELVDAANSVLRERPRLKLSIRTARYYITEGLLPPPSNVSKFARYGAEHLARLVGARCLQDKGMSLSEARDALDNMRDVVAEVSELAESNPQDAILQSSRSAPPTNQDPQVPTADPDVSTVNRVQLTPFATLEITARSDQLRELRRAAKELDRLIDRGGIDKI